MGRLNIGCRMRGIGMVRPQQVVGVDMRGFGVFQNGPENVVRLRDPGGERRRWAALFIRATLRHQIDGVLEFWNLTFGHDWSRKQTTPTGPGLRANARGPSGRPTPEIILTRHHDGSTAN